MPESWSWPNFTRNALLIAAAIALTAWIAIESLIPSLVPKNFGVVVENAVYRSGELTPAATRAVVREHDIKTILDFGAHEAGTPEQAREEATAAALGVDYIRLTLWGNAVGDPNHYARALRIMSDPNAQPVLVHCAAGSERTGCAVALFRSIVEGLPDDQALAETTTFRHDPEDNPLLTETFHTWRDEIERVYREGGFIDYDGTAREDGGRATEPLPPPTPNTETNADPNAG